MRNIIIRNVDDDIIFRINEMARKKGISREEFLRNMLKTISLSGELKELDYKYANIVNLLVDQSNMLSDVIDRNTYVLETLYENKKGEWDE